MITTKSLQVYQIALSYLPEVGPVKGKKLASLYPYLPDIFQLASYRPFARDVLREAEKTVLICQADEVEILYFEDSAYPQRIKDLYDAPLILFKKQRILCWGNPDQIVEFTTTFNVADFTAEVALDDNTPRFLRIAGDRLSCNDFVKLLTEITNEKYKLFRPGGIGLLNTVIALTRFFSPSKNELYPAWQGMQYMRDMMEGRIIFQEYANDRYTNIQFTSVKEFLFQEKIDTK
jgi:hypothetical protein